MKSNCLFWALAKKVKHGGKINWCKARTWFGFHATWTDPETNITWEYTVTDQSKKQWWYVPILYKGIVKKIKIN